MEKEPKIVIEIPEGVDKKIKEYQALRTKLGLPRMTKKEILVHVIDLYGPRWLGKRIAIVKEAVEAVAKV